MTSTNDDKDVKNTTDDNATKGKTQFVEINRSLDYETLSDVPFVQRAPMLASVWRAATSPPAPPKLLRNLHRITLLFVLQEEWPKLEESAQTDLRSSVEACADALEAAGGPGVVRRLRYLLRTAAHPWHHPTLRLIMEGGQPQKEQVESWFREECCAGALERLRQLCAAGGSACSGAGLRLARALLLLPAAAGARRAALDALLVLLVRAGSTTDCITEIKALDTREAVAVIARLSTRDKSSGRLWKHAHDTALLCAQVMVAACIVRPLQGGQLAALAAQLTSLYKSRPDRLLPVLRKLLQPAETAMHIYIVCRAVQHQFGDTMRAFVCELYIRALTTGMNELERQKLQGEDSAAATATSHQLAGWFLSLADYLSSNCSVSSECVLTAFSLHPSRECYRRVEECSTKMSITKKFLEPEDGSSLSTEETKNTTSNRNCSGNLLKTSGEVSDAVEGLIRLGMGVSECISERSTKMSEKCLIDLSLNSLKKDVDDSFSDVCDGNGLAQRLVSGAVLDGEGLGLTVETCRDLAVLLSGPRLKMLTWELNWKDLSRHCLSYMKDTQEGTKAITRELKYLHLDYSQYEQIEPEVHDIYFGIEKGYEHHLEIEEDDEEDYWEEDLQDFNEDNVIKSGDEQEYVDGKKETKKVKKKSSKKHIASDNEGATARVKKPDKCKRPKKEKKPKEEKTCSKGKGKHKKGTKTSPSTEIIECEIVQDDTHLIRENVSKDDADDGDRQLSYIPTSKKSIFESQFSAFYNRKHLSSTSLNPSTSFTKYPTPVQRDVKSSVPAAATASTNETSKSNGANKHVSLYRLQMDRFEAWRNQRFEQELGFKKDTSTAEMKNTHIKSEPESKDNSTSSVENSLCNSLTERKPVFARVPKMERSDSVLQDDSYRRYDLADGEEELIRKNVLAELLSENKSVIRTVESTRAPAIKVEPPAAKSSLLTFRKNSVKKIVPNISTNVTELSNMQQTTISTNVTPDSKVSLLNASPAVIPSNIVANSKVSLLNTSPTAIPSNIVANPKVSLLNTSQAAIPSNIVANSKVSLLNTSQAATPTNVVPNSKVSLPRSHLSQPLEKNSDYPLLDSTLSRLVHQNSPIPPVKSKMTCTDHSIARLSSISSPGNVNQRTSRETTEQPPRESFIFNLSQRSLPKPLEDPRLELMRHLLPQTDVKVYHPKNSSRNVNQSPDPHPDPSPKQPDHIHGRNQSALNIVNKSVSALIHKSYQQSIPKVSERSSSSTLQTQQRVPESSKHSQSDKVKYSSNVPPKLEVKKEPSDISDMVVCDEKLLETWLDQKNTIRNLTQVPGYMFANKPVYVQRQSSIDKIHPSKSTMSAIRSAYLESVQNYPTDLLTKNDSRPVVTYASKFHSQSNEGSVKTIAKDDKQAQKLLLKTADGGQQMKIKIQNAASFDSLNLPGSPRRKERKQKQKNFKQPCEEMRREPAVSDALSKLNKIMDIQIQKLQAKHSHISAPSPVVAKSSKEPTKLTIQKEIKTTEKNAAELGPSQKMVNPIHKIVKELQHTKNKVENASLIMKEKQKLILSNAVAVANSGRKEANEYRTFLSEMQAMVNAGSGSQSAQESNPKDVAAENRIESVVVKPEQSYTAAGRKPSTSIKDFQIKDSNAASAPCQDKQTVFINSLGEKVKFSPIKITYAPTVQQDSPVKHGNTIDSSKIKQVLHQIQSKPAFLKDSLCLGAKVEQTVQENASVNNLMLSSKSAKRDSKKNNSSVLQTYARKNYCSIMKKQSALKALEMALTQNQISSDDNSVALRMAPQQQLHRSVPKMIQNMPSPPNRNLDQCGSSAGAGKTFDSTRKSTPDTLQKVTDNLQVAISRISGNNDLVIKHPNKPADSVVQEQIKKVPVIVRSSVQSTDTKRASPKKKLKSPSISVSDRNKLQAKVKSSENLSTVPKSDSRSLGIPSTSQESSEYKEPWTPLQWGLRHVKNLSDVSITHQPLPSFSTFARKTADASDKGASAEIPVPYLVTNSAAQKTPSECLSSILNVPKPSTDPPPQIVSKTEVVSKSVLLKELLSGHISISNSKFVEPLDVHSHKDASNKNTFTKELISTGGSFKIEQRNPAQCSAEPVEQKFDDTNDISDLMEIIRGDLGSHTIKPVPVEITGSERSDIHITRRDVILANLPENIHSKPHPVLTNDNEDLADHWSSDVMGALSQSNPDSNASQIDSEIVDKEATSLVSRSQKEIFQSDIERTKVVNTISPKEVCPTDPTPQVEEIDAGFIKNAVIIPHPVDRHIPLKSSLPNISETIAKVNVALKECRATVIDTSRKPKPCVKRRIIIKTDKPMEIQDICASENLPDQSVNDTGDLVHSFKLPTDDKCVVNSKLSDGSGLPVDSSNDPKQIENPEQLKESYLTPDGKLNDCYVLLEKLPRSSKAPLDLSNSDSFTILEKSPSESKHLSDFSESSRASFTILKELANEPDNVPKMQSDYNETLREPTHLRIPELSNTSSIVLDLIPEVSKETKFLKSSKLSNVPNILTSSNVTEMQEESNEFEKCNVLNKHDAALEEELQEDSTACEVLIDYSNNTDQVQRRSHEFEQSEIALSESDDVPEGDCISKELKDDSVTSEIPIETFDNVQAQKRTDEFEQSEIVLNRPDAITEDDCISREFKKKYGVFYKVPLESSHIEKIADESEQSETVLNKSDTILEDDSISKELKEDSVFYEVPIDSSANLEVQKMVDEFEQTEIVLNKSDTIPEEHCISTELKDDSAVFEVPIDSSNIKVQKKADEESEMDLNDSDAIPEDLCKSKELKEDSTASEVPVDSSDNTEVQKRSDKFEQSKTILNKSDVVPEKDCISQELKEDSTTSEVLIDLSDGVEVQERSDEFEHSEIVVSKELNEGYNVSQLSHGSVGLDTVSNGFSSSPVVLNQSDSISDAAINELQKESEVPINPPKNIESQKQSSEFSTSDALSNVISDNSSTLGELRGSGVSEVHFGSGNDVDLHKESNVVSSSARVDPIPEDSSNLKKLPADYNTSKIQINSCIDELQNESNELSNQTESHLSNKQSWESSLSPEVSKDSTVCSNVSKNSVESDHTKLNLSETISYSSKISKEILLEDSSGSDSSTDSSESGLEEQNSGKLDDKLGKVVKIVLTRILTEHLKSKLDKKESEEVDKSAENDKNEPIEKSSLNQMVNIEPIEISGEEILDVLLEADELPPKDPKSEKLKIILPPENIVEDQFKVETTQTISPNADDDNLKKIPTENDEVIDLISDDEVEMYIPDDPIGLDCVEESLPKHVDATITTPSFITVVDEIKSEKFNLDKHKYGLRKKRVKKTLPPPFLVFAGKFIKGVSVPLEDQQKLKMLCCVSLISEDLPRLQQSCAQTFGAQNLNTTKLEGKKEEIANTSKRKQCKMNSDPKQKITLPAVEYAKLNQNKNVSLPNKRIRKEKIFSDISEVKSEDAVSKSQSSDITSHTTTDSTPKASEHFQPIDEELEANPHNLAKEKLDLNSNEKVEKFIISSIQKDTVTFVMDGKCSEKPNEDLLSSENQIINDTVKLENLDRNDPTNIADFTDSDGENFVSDWKADVKNETDHEDNENIEKENANIQESTPDNDMDEDLDNYFLHDLEMGSKGQDSSGDSFPTKDSSNTATLSVSTFLTAFESFITGNNAKHNPLCEISVEEEPHTVGEQNILDNSEVSDKEMITRNTDEMHEPSETLVVKFDYEKSINCVPIARNLFSNCKVPKLSFISMLIVRDLIAATSDHDAEMNVSQEVTEIICNPENSICKLKEKSSLVSLSIERDLIAVTSEHDEEMNVSQEVTEIICNPENSICKLKEKLSLVSLSIERDLIAATSDHDEEINVTQEDTEIICIPENSICKLKEKLSLVSLSIDRDLIAATSDHDEEINVTQEDTEIICIPENCKLKEKSSLISLSTSQHDEEMNIIQKEGSMKLIKLETGTESMNVSMNKEDLTILDDLKTESPDTDKMHKQDETPMSIFDKPIPPSNVIVEDMEINEKPFIVCTSAVRDLESSDSLIEEMDKNIGLEMCDPIEMSKIIKEEYVNLMENSLKGKLLSPVDTIEGLQCASEAKFSSTAVKTIKSSSVGMVVVRDLGFSESDADDKTTVLSDSHVEEIGKNIGFEIRDPIEMSKIIKEDVNLMEKSLKGKLSSPEDTMEGLQCVSEAKFSKSKKNKTIKSSSVGMVVVRDLAVSESDADETTVLSERCLEDNILSFKRSTNKPQTEKPSVGSMKSEMQTPEAVVENDDVSENVIARESGSIIDVTSAECDDVEKIFDDLADLEVMDFREENPVFKNPIRTYQKTASSSSTRKRKLDVDVRNSTKNPRINLPLTQDRNMTSVDEVIYDNFSVKEILMMDDYRDNLPETTEEDLEVVSFDKTKFDQNDFLFDTPDISNFDGCEESPRESFYSPIFTEDERNRDTDHPVDDFIVNNIDMEDLNGERKTDGSGFREGFGFRSGREDTSDSLHGRPHGPAAALPDSSNPRLPRTPHTARASHSAEESKVRKLLVTQANSENRFNDCLLEKRARKHSKKARRRVSPLGNRNRIKGDLSKHLVFTDLKETKNRNKYKRSDWTDDIFSRIPGMRDLDFIRPAPTVAVVNVVQLGQLPVSSAQQSPMPGTPTRPNTTGEYLDIASNNSAEYRSPTHEDSRQSGNQENELPDLNESNAEGSVNNHNADESNNETSDANNSPKVEDKHSSETVTVQDALNLSTSTSSHMMDGNVQLIFTSQPLTQHTYVTSDVQSEHKEVSRENIIETSVNSTHTTNSSFIPVSRAQTLVNILSQKILRPPVSGVGTQQLQMATFPKGTPINALSLQQALAQILPPPLSQASSDGSTSVGHSSGPQVVHIVQGKTGGQPGSSFSGLLMDGSQQSVVSASGGTQVLHIVQGKNTTANSNSGVIGQTQLSGATFGGLSLVDGSQQSGNQVLHILNAGSQAKHNAAATQLLKRVNLLTSLTNTQGNEQKMVQFLCKSADGKSIQLSSQHQRGMVLRLQPIQSETPTAVLQKTSESPGVITNTSPMQSGIKKSPQADQSQEIKSRSIYEENYAKFIQNSSSKLSPISPDRSTSLPKFNQAFGKSVFQDSNSVPKNSDSVECNQNQSGPVSNEQPAQDLSTAINLAQMGQLSSPPLLIRKTHQPGSTQNLVGQVKPSGAPMNIQTMHGGVIYTRQIPVNIGGGQTINLITVPSSDIIDEAHLQAIQKQAQEKANMGDQQGEQQVIKLVSQEQQQQQSNISVCHMDSASDDANQGFAEQTQNTVNTHPLLTQMRIKVPMLSKGGTQMVAGTRVVRPVLQIQRNVIPGTNPAVYQQLVLTTAPALRPPTPAPQQPVRPPRPPTAPQQESNLSSSTLEQLREFDMVLEQVKERSTVQPGSNSNSAFSESSPQRQSVDNSDIISSQPNVGQTTQREVLYSIGPNQTVNVTYVNQKVLTSTASVLGSSYSSNPEAPAIVNIGQQNSPSLQIAHGLSNSINHPKPNTPTKISTKSMKPKTSKPPSNITPSSSKASPVAPKTSLQKPLEDEQTTQRILYILAEYKEQVENSPDKDKPAPRRRSNPPTNPSTSSKRKKGSSSSSKKGGNGQSMQEMSPSGDDTGHTMGSEDSSCGLSQGDCADNSIQGPESQSPQGSPQKAARKLVFPQEQEANATPVTQPQRNIVIADGQTIAMTRPGPGGKATAVLMPANYLLPMSMMKGGQQITIVTNQGPKILSVPHGEGGTTNTLFLQRLISPAGLKPMLTRPGQVRQVRLPANTVQNLQAFNLTTSNANNQDISWIGNNQQPKLLVEYSPNVTVGQDLNPDSVKSEASDAQSLKEENMSIGSESLATPRHSDSREALSDDLNMKSNRSGDEGIFSGQTDSATDDSIQSSIQNRNEQMLQHAQVSKNTTNHTVNLIQVHSLNPNEPGKIFSVQNPASLGSLIQLAGKTSLGQTFQTINVSGMNQENSKVSQEVQECAQNLLLVRKQFDGQFAVNEAANDADLKSSSSVGMQQDLQSVDASPSPGSQQNYGLGHGDQLDDGHSLKVNSDANVPWSLTSNGGSTASHGGDGASPAYAGYLAHHRDNGMTEHADDGRVLRHPYSPETESPTPGAPRHLYHKMFISSPDKQDHIGNDDKSYHHQDHHLKKEDNSQSSTITLHTSNSPSFTIHHHQHHSSVHAHHAQPHHHHAQPSHHHTQPSHHGKGAEGRGGSGAEHGGRSGGQGSVPAHVLRHKYALIEHELRLQKSLSEECEDLGVDSPSASDLFPEAELLFAASPSSQFDQSQDGQTAAPPLPPAKDDHIGPVEEEFARMHPNTTFHSGEIEIGGDDAEDISFRGSAAKRSAVRTQLSRRNEVVRSVIEGVGSSGMAASYQPSKVTTHFSMVGLPRRTLNVMSSLQSSDDNSEGADSMNSESKDGLVNNKHLDGMLNSESPGCIASNIIQRNVAQVIRHANEGQLSLAGKDNTGKLCNESSPGIAQNGRSFLLESSNDTRPGDSMILKTLMMERDGRDGLTCSSPEQHSELFWESNSNSNQSEEPLPHHGPTNLLDFSSEDSNKCCKSPASCEETNSTDSSSIGGHNAESHKPLRLNSVIKTGNSSSAADGPILHSALTANMPNISGQDANRKLELNTSHNDSNTSTSPDGEDPNSRRTWGRSLKSSGMRRVLSPRSLSAEINMGAEIETSSSEGVNILTKQSGGSVMHSGSSTPEETVPSGRRASLRGTGQARRSCHCCPPPSPAPHAPQSSKGRARRKPPPTAH